MRWFTAALVSSVGASLVATEAPGCHDQEQQRESQHCGGMHDRRMDYENIPTVVAFGKIEGKGATNIIPEKVEIEGTFRTMNEEWRLSVHRQLQQIVRDVSRKYGVISEIEIKKGYPFLVNDVRFTENCASAARVYLGEDKVENLPLRMTAEDFAFITQVVPSCFFRLGIDNKERGITSGVHTATFDIDESALEVGAGLMAWLAVEGLRHITSR